MRRSAMLRLVPRVVLLLAGCLSVAMAAALATHADSARAVVKRPPPSRWAAAVMMAVPSGGDVSYGVVRVRIARGARLMLPAGLAGEQTVFSGRVGGLAMRAQSHQWRALRATTRVYVIVAPVRGAGASVRDVALFVVRRKASGGPPSAQVTFTIANARAELGSFWVHGIDRHGYADIFKARNILSTALANWGRYVRAIQAADAVQAAMHPLLAAASRVAALSAARSRMSGPWTGGQHPDARVLAMYRLLVGEVNDPIGYGALKLSPLVPSFIATELGNPSLAARWRAVAAHVPVTVPDQYAALAQEEKRFTHVVPARLSHAVVAIADTNNSSAQLTWDSGLGPHPANLIIDIPPGPGAGSVEVHNPDLSLVGICSSHCLYRFSVTPLSQPTVPYVLLKVIPNGDSFLSQGTGCTSAWNGPTCRVDLSPGDKTVAIGFAPAYRLSVTVQSRGSRGDLVTGNPPGIFCPTSCSANFAIGSTVTLTARPRPGESLSSWSGCDQTSGDTCTVTMSQIKNVTASFVPTDQLTVTLQTNLPGHTGTVTSSPAGIDCGTTCSASFSDGSTVTLTAADAPQAIFVSWSGCDQVSGNRCTVAMYQAKNVVATYAW